MNWFNWNKKIEPEVVDKLKVRRSMIGRKIIASITVKAITPPYGAMEITRVTEAAPIFGIITDAGLRTWKIDDKWYEDDWREVGGIRVIEIIDTETK